MEYAKIPKNQLVPWFYIDFDSSLAFNSSFEYKTLLIGEKELQESFKKNNPSGDCEYFSISKDNLKGLIDPKVLKDPKENTYKDLVRKLENENYNIIGLQWCVPEVLINLKTVLEKRWKSENQLDGIVFTCSTEPEDKQIEIAASLNSPYFSILSLQLENKSLPNFAHIVGSLCGAVSFFGNDHPAKPFSSIKLTDAKTTNLKEVFKNDRNKRLKNGLSTAIINKTTDEIFLESLVTTYTKTVKNSPDSSYRYVNTLLTLSEIRRDLSTYIINKYKRALLSNNDSLNVSPNIQVLTPAVFKSEVLARAADYERKGLIQNSAGLADSMQVRVNKENPCRIDVLFNPELMKQARVFTGNIYFK